MKRCKFIIGMCVLLTFTSFHTAYAEEDEALTHVREIKEYLKGQLPAFYAQLIIKENKNEAALIAAHAPSTITKDLQQDKEQLLDSYGNPISTSVSDSSVLTNNELPLPITTLEYFTSIYTQTLSKWNILRSLWYLAFPENFGKTSSTPDMTPTQIMDTHLDKFCDPSHKGSNECKNSKNNPDLFYADVNIGNLLNKDITTNDFVFATAIANVVDPLPSPIYRNMMIGGGVEKLLQVFSGLSGASTSPTIPGSPTAKEKEEEKEDPAKQLEKFKDTLSETAALSTAYYTLEQMYNVRKQLVLPDKDGVNKATSMLRIMKSEADRRFLNKEWQNDINKASTEALLRELANIKAFMAKLAIERFHQGERVELLIATQVSGDIQGQRAVDKMAEDIEELEQKIEDFNPDEVDDKELKDMGLTDEDLKESEDYDENDY